MKESSSYGMKYIGKSINDNPEYLGSGVRLQNAIKKYGKENFKKQILQDSIINEEDLNEAEKYWCDYFGVKNSNIFYNLTNGGEGGDTISDHPNKDQIYQQRQKRHQQKLIDFPEVALQQKENRIKAYTSEKYRSNASQGQIKRNIRRKALNIPHHTYTEKMKRGNFNKKGRRQSEEMKEKIRAKKKIITCPHCNVSSKGATSMKRFHFENCKMSLSREEYQKRLNERPLLVCPHCQYECRNKGSIMKNHFDRCKYKAATENG